MKILATTPGAVILLAGAAHAQTGSPVDPNMKCSGYLAVEKEAGTLGKPSGDANIDALEKKIVEYCTAHPDEPATKITEKEMSK